MKPKDIKHLFPITLKVTEKHRAEAEKNYKTEDGRTHNLGFVLLKEVIPEELHEKMFWGLSIGNIGEVLLETEHEIFHNGKKEKTTLYLDKNFLGDEVTFKIRRD